MSDRPEKPRFYRVVFWSFFPPETPREKTMIVKAWDARDAVWQVEIIERSMNALNPTWNFSVRMIEAAEMS